MSNHLHLIVRTRPDIVIKWSDHDAVRRMLTAHRIIHSLDGEVEPPSNADIQFELSNPKRVLKLRDRLRDLSWFMKTLRETIARRANRSDGVTGAFWNGRFRCRRLMDETAIVICGIYVDLNQIRAREAATPEQSTHTSAFDRICGWQMRHQAMLASSADENDTKTNVAGGDLERIAMTAPDGWLGELTLNEGPGATDSEWNLRSRTGRRASDKGLLPLTLEKYLELLDWTGRQLIEGKRGAIPASFAPIFERLRIRSERWLELIEHFEEWFRTFVGHMDELRQVSIRTGRRYLRGIRQCAAAFL
jgi:hypothetical protein